MNRHLLVGFLVFGLIVALPAKADWIIGSDGSVTRSEVLGDDSEKKEEKQENKQEDKKEEKKEEKKEKKEEKEEKNKSKIEIQEGSVQLKIDRENGVLKIKSKNEKGEEFELETKQEDKVKIEDDDVEIATSSGTGLKISRGTVEAETELPVEVDTKTRKLKIDGKEILTPDRAVNGINASGSAAVTTKMELKNRGQEMVYEISQKEKKKLFGLIDVAFSKVSIVAADNGQVLEVVQNWWSNLLENFTR